MQRSGYIGLSIALLIFGAGLHVSYLMTRDRVDVTRVLGQALVPSARLVYARDAGAALIAEIALPESERRLTVVRVPSLLTGTIGQLVASTKRYVGERVLDPAWPEVLLQLTAAHMDPRRMFRESELALPELGASAFVFEGRKRVRLALVLLHDEDQTLLVIVQQKKRDFEAQVLQEVIRSVVKFQSGSFPPAGSSHFAS